MILLLIAFTLLAGLWVYMTRGSYRRSWSGETRRLFEREWEFKTDKQRLYFSIPSYKTAYFDLRPANFWSQGMNRIKSFAPTAIEKQFYILAEDPRLMELFSEHTTVLEALTSLQELGHFRILSTGQELHGWIQFTTPMKEDVYSSADFTRLTGILSALLEFQFDLPLNEMKPSEIKGWRRSSTLPFAMLGAGLVLLALRPLLVTSDLILEPKAFKVWLGLSLFVTGLGLLWSALRVPHQYFIRVALTYVLLFSWSSFFWLHGVFTSLNRMFASDSFVVECQVQSENGVNSCVDAQTQVRFYLPRGEPKDSANPFKFEAQMGWLGQVFFISANPAAMSSAEALTTEAPVQGRDALGAPATADGSFPGAAAPSATTADPLNTTMEDELDPAVGDVIDTSDKLPGLPTSAEIPEGLPTDVE